MGVRGLTALIKRYAPKAIATINDGLQHFREPDWSAVVACQPAELSTGGQTIVLDGHLAIQRLHFGSTDSHPHRSLPSLYRLLSTLRAHDVRPVVLFDGPSRPIEKQREHKRRAKLLELQKWRAEREEERGQRLGELEVLMRHILEMEDGGMRKAAVRHLEEALKEQHPSAGESASGRILATLDHLRRILSRRRLLEAKQEYYGDVEAEAYAELDALASLPPDALPPRPKRPLATADVSRKLVDLYASFQTFADLAPASSSDEDGPRPSKNQQLISTAELDAFQSLASLATTPASPAYEMVNIDTPLYDPRYEAAEHLADLATLSQTLAQVYRRRTQPPSSSTYEAARSLLDTMGVPALLTPDHTEAEALASSLVLAGQADAVASEDTDVVVYEADLVRKLADGNQLVEGAGGSPVLMKGKDMRQELGLTREQWVDLALLCGTDYLETLPGIAGVRGLRLVREHGSIEKILDLIPPRHQPMSGTVQYLSALNAARQLYLKPPAVSSGLDLVQRAEGDVDAVWKRLGIEVESSDSFMHGWDIVGRSLGDAPGVGGPESFESASWKG